MLNATEPFQTCHIPPIKHTNVVRCLATTLCALILYLLYFRTPPGGDLPGVGAGAPVHRDERGVALRAGLGAGAGPQHAPGPGPQPAGVAARRHGSVLASTFGDTLNPFMHEALHGYGKL